MDYFLAILPIAILIWVMTKKQPWPSHLALPFAASLVYFIVLAYFHNDPNLVNATGGERGVVRVDTDFNYLGCHPSFPRPCGVRVPSTS
jgi:L-lactate permease